MNKWLIASGATALAMGAVLWGSNAQAQYESAPPPTYTAPTYEAPAPRTMTAPSNAFELQIGTGYTQGFGNVFSGTPILDVAGAGIGFTGDIGYRVNPALSIEAEGQYQQFTSENSNASNGVDLNLGATIHGMPYGRVDPWFRIGTGWRWVWQHSPTITAGFGNFGTTNTFSGWEVATARLGLDLRGSSGVAVAPFVGADLQSFIWNNGTSFSPWQWGTYVYAGLQGRFDIGGPQPVRVAKQ